MCDGEESPFVAEKAPLEADESMTIFSSGSVISLFLSWNYLNILSYTIRCFSVFFVRCTHISISEHLLEGI